MSISGGQMPSWSPDLPDDQKDEALRTSLKITRDSLQQLTNGVIVYTQMQEEFSWTQTTATIIPQFSKAFAVSGGLTEITFKTAANVTGASGMLGLYVNDALVDYVVCSNMDDMQICLMYKSKLPRGNQKVSVKAWVSGGVTMKLGLSGSYSTLWVVETVL